MDGRPPLVTAGATVPWVTVEETCATYLDLADRYAPGLVQGLYLQGSIALGDYRPGISDIDFVAVVSRTPDVRTLASVHADLRRVRGSILFDGLYVEADDLRRDPALAESTRENLAGYWTRWRKVTARGPTCW